MSDKQILENGYQALSQDLGIKFYYFINQFYKGHGDYTKEKYENPPLAMEEIIKNLSKYVSEEVDFVK